jgi:hypothetical protein
VSEPLATVDDLAARMQRTLSDEEQIRAYYLLQDASATVRNYCRRDFTSDETTMRVRVRNGKIRLPNSPVTAVSSITDMDGNDVTFTWYSGSTIDFTSTPLNAWELNGSIRPQWVDVTYTHGYDQIPDTVIAIVCRLAATALDTPAEDAGTQSESIAGYSYTRGAIAASGGLFGEEKAQLDAFRIVGGTSRIAS